jgi:hypothetical protein
MIDSPAVPAVEKEGAQPLRHKLVIPGITFEEGKLWKPRYPSLVEYGRLPGIQVEPAIRLRAKNPREVEITFEIAEGQGVTFVPEEGGVRCRTIDKPRDEDIPIHGLVETRLEKEGRRCTLVWNQAAANEPMVERFQDAGRRKEITTLRVFCQKKEGLPKEDEVMTAVEGGLYVALLYTPRDGEMPPVVDLKTPGFEKPAEESVATKPEIRVVAIDSHDRPVYDLFRPFLADTFLDPELELEPAFRVREWETVELDLVLAVQGLPGLRWKSSRGEADVIPISAAEGRPRPLKTTESWPDEGRCRIRWVQETGRSACVDGSEEARRCYCHTGRTSSFLFSATPRLSDLVGPVPEHFLNHPGFLKGDNPVKFLSRINIDPTVIEPPTCTPDGVCIPTGGGGRGGTQ